MAKICVFIEDIATTSVLVFLMLFIQFLVPRTNKVPSVFYLHFITFPFK
jgi:hypothetical protein